MTATHLPNDPVIPQDVTLDERQQRMIDAAEEAMGKIRQSFEQWLVVGRAFQEVQLEAMHRSNSNAPSGRRYSDYHEFLLGRYVNTRPHLATISPSMRGRAIWMVEHEAEVRAWRASLKDFQRDNWNNPSTIRRHFLAPHTLRDDEDSSDDPAAAALAEEFEDDDLPGGEDAAASRTKKRPKRSAVDVEAMTATITAQQDEIRALMDENARLRARVGELETGHAEQADEIERLLTLTHGCMH